MEEKIHLHSLKFMLSLFATDKSTEDKAKGKSVIPSSSHSTSVTLGKRSREVEKESSTIGSSEPSSFSVRDYNAGVRDVYMKIAEELPGIRKQFRREGWFMAVKKAGLDADKTGLGYGPPFDRTPVVLNDSDSVSESDFDSDSDSSSSAE